MKKLKIFDTTLRDGEQGIGCRMTFSQKESILRQIDNLGLSYIEIGIPSASREDHNWIKHVLTTPLNTTPCLFSRLTKGDMDNVISASNGAKIQVQLLGTGSEIHLEKKRKITKKESLIELQKSIKYLQTHGLHNISVALEDATRGSIGLIKDTIKVCIDYGASSVTIADTLGCALPDKIFSIIDTIKAITPDHLDIGIHCHNDMGLAVANTLSGIQAGADIIQTTMGGLGERTGNCPIEEILTVLHFYSEEYGVTVNINLIELVKTCNFVFQTLNKSFAPNKPILGEHVFSTAAGIHQDGILKDPSTYEYVKPELFGRQRVLIFNRLSGRKLIKLALDDLIPESVLFESFYEYLINTNRDFTQSEIKDEFKTFLRLHIEDEKNE